MAISATPAGGGTPPPNFASPRPNQAELKEQNGDRQASEAQNKNLQHVQRGFQRLMDRLRSKLAADNHNISFQAGLDEDPVIIITDKDTGKVIREIPPSELRRLAEQLEQLKGVFLNQVG